MKPDSWIRDGACMARTLLDAGFGTEAAGVLEYVERHAILAPHTPGLPLLPFCDRPRCTTRTTQGRLCWTHRPRAEMWPRRPCAVKECGCVAIVARRFCKQHRPRFEDPARTIAARMRRVA